MELSFDELNRFNAALAKRMQSLKTDMRVASVRQSYHGTGGKAYRRQIWVEFTPGCSIDVWLEHRANLGGIIRPPIGTEWSLAYTGNETVDSVYENMKVALRRYCDAKGIVP